MIENEREEQEERQKNIAVKVAVQNFLKTGILEHYINSVVQRSYRDSNMVYSLRELLAFKKRLEEIAINE